ncbi:hypothetical protein [Stenotrophomonas sp. CFBP8980]|uniref:hypothetical protein n=1 Tax=Stenotrophomonas sp. CFBP8980 TaxID=3096523 RepID=UPI002A69D14C|nr:hypothetical protein [Stenotrophomonas sp. CFBP8980]MDY1033396.1 hypothetical protein [Stenotrophomonas sp. CFBP8980]
MLAAALILTPVHFEADTPDDAERRRKAAYSLLAKHRTDAGIRTRKDAQVTPPPPPPAGTDEIQPSMR